MYDIHVEGSAAKRAEGVEAWWLSSLSVPRMSTMRVRQTPILLAGRRKMTPRLPTDIVGFPHISNECIKSTNVTNKQFPSHAKIAQAIM